MPTYVQCNLLTFILALNDYKKLKIMISNGLKTLWNITQKLGCTV